MITLKAMLEMLSTNYNRISVMYDGDDTTLTFFPNDGYENGQKERDADILARYGANTFVSGFDSDPEHNSPNMRIRLNPAQFREETLKPSRKLVTFTINYWCDYYNFYGDSNLDVEECREEIRRKIRDGEISFKPDDFDIELFDSKTW